MSPAPHPRMHGLTHVKGGPDPVPGLLPPTGGGTWIELVQDPDLTAWWRLGDTFTPATSVSLAAVDSADFDAESPRSMDYKQSSSDGPPTLDYANANIDPDDDGAVKFSGHSVSLCRFEMLANTARWDVTKFEPAGDSARTWICWFETPTPMATSAGYTSPLFGRWGMDLSGSFDLGWVVEINRTDNKLRWRLKTITPTEVALESAALSAGTWYMAAGTYDGSTYKLYLNGLLADSEASAVEPDDPATIMWRIGAITYDLAAGSITYPHTGAVDEVALYKRALSAAEIAQLGGAAGFEDQTGYVATIQDDGTIDWDAPTLLVNY